VRVLVIGGTNFIGPPVVTELHRQGHEVTVYHRGIHEPDLPPGIRHIHSHRAAIPVLHFPSSLSNPAPDIVLHMFPVGEDDARAAAARFAGVAQRMVAISSADVYRAYGRLLGTEPGPAEPVPLHESAPLREIHFPYRHGAAGPMDWTYHYDKILVERAMIESRLQTTVIRLPAVYGPGDQHRRFRPFIKRMLDRRPFILIESLQAEWRWTHGYVENVARAIATCVIDERAAGKIYNVGELATPTMAERIRGIARTIGWGGTLIPLSQEKLPQHLKVPYQPRQQLIVDSGKIRSELGYRETVREEDGLRRTIEWESADGIVGGDPGTAEYAAEDQAAHRGAT
jgi:nucleoside-diphosphate-sugar epimerase